MNGMERFELDGKALDFTILDFWSYQYSNIYNIQEYIMEFLVARALGITKAQNVETWTLFDMLYRENRIEIKESSYYHPWNEGGKVTDQRVFSIRKANSNYESTQKPESEQEEERYERQNDIYVFCLNTGRDKASAYPLSLNHWEFYIVPTKVINAYCGDNKTISLGRIQSLGVTAKRYDEIKSTIDAIIDEKEKEKQASYAK